MNMRLVLASAGLTSAIPLVAVASEAAAEHAQPNLFTGDLGNVFWSLATFFLVVIVLGKFAWRPILGALRKREEFIRDSLRQAKSEREAAERQLREYTEKIIAARSEATAIVEEGRRDAEALKRKLEEVGRTEAAAMAERARREIAIATETAIKEIHTHTAHLATEVASRIIRKQLDAKEQERLVRESLVELEKAMRN